MLGVSFNENAFGVVDVIQGFAKGPFSGFMPVARSIFGDVVEEGQESFGLRVEVCEDVVRSRFVDVGEAVFGGFVAGG